jgi:hypothetical protein
MIRGILLVLGVLSAQASAQLPDIATVEPDLVVPELSEGKPAAGKRVKQTLPGFAETKAYHVLYLPTDWKAGSKYPVIVEFAGNGPYKNSYGDISTGHVEGSRLGYGISGGKGFIWLCLPYLNGEGTANVTRWWGTKPAYNAQPTIDYCIEAVNWICTMSGGDREKVVLCGFSRGAIACNFLGLHDDGIAKLWRAFIPYSHYDGVHTGWPYPGSDRASALKRLQRLEDRPQFICGEGTNAQQTARYLRETKVEGKFTIRGTGFRNHNDAWVLRPSPVRKELREWVRKVLED